MNISALQPRIDPAHVAVENLAGSRALTEEQKIGEASRQFEAILLRQFLSEAQKPCFKSEFTDDSSEAGIYQDMVTNQLADSLSQGGGVGLAASFQHQLTHHGAGAAPAAGQSEPKTPVASAAETHRPAAGATKTISHP